VRGWLPHFSILHEVRRAYDANGETDRELEEEVDRAINDLEEDLYSSVETKAVPLLAALRDRDESILIDDDQCLDFAWFIAMQYLRTPRIMQGAIAIREIPGFNADAAWGLLRTILATTLGWSVYEQRRTMRVTFLEAPDGVDFVTGDQPVVNARGVGATGNEPPTELEFYYPLTPNRALLLGFNLDSCSSECRTLTREACERYNQMIAVMADEQIYARSEETLLTLGCVQPPKT
ncbi:MAG: DUF4238 domain-containing protein, partial [Polyangiaceae bacterium]